MDDISTAVITSISHGHTETLLHLGLKPDGVPDNDARVLYEAAVELLRDKKKINRLALMVRVSGKLQDIKSVDDIFSLKIGGAVHHLNQPVQKFASGSTYKLPMRYVGNAQARIDIKGTKIAILPSVVYLRQATASEIIVGTHIRYRFKNPTKVTGMKSETGLNIGVYYRVGDAIIPQVNLDMGKYAVGVAYDLNISKYKQVSQMQGGFEIYLKFMTLDDALFKRKREHGLN